MEAYYAARVCVIGINLVGVVVAVFVALFLLDALFVAFILNNRNVATVVSILVDAVYVVVYSGGRCALADNFHASAIGHLYLFLCFLLWNKIQIIDLCHHSCRKKHHHQ